MCAGVVQCYSYRDGMLVSQPAASDAILIFSLHATSSEYHYFLNRKRQSEAVEDAEKPLPVDALGVVMIRHGEEYGEDSAFGEPFGCSADVIIQVSQGYHW